jgi:hypothetical protein
MAYRNKGEYVRPTRTLELMDKEGPTRAAKSLGVSTSRLHKARREMKVSKIVEVAANALLKGPAHRAEMTSPEPAPISEMHSFSPSPAAEQRRGEETMFLLSVPTEKAELVRRFADMLDAECLSA